MNQFWNVEAISRWEAYKFPKIRLKDPIYKDSTYPRKALRAKLNARPLIQTSKALLWIFEIQLQPPK